MKYDLSILIPARNEMWLTQTIDDILAHKKGNTEIIVGLEGYWPTPPIKDHPDVTIVHTSQPFGQRGMTNQLCQLSRAKYVAKTDAHCAFDDGFDVKLLEGFKKTGDNAVVVPIMRNLWIFNWLCKKCGNETYQGPTPTKCEKCDNTTEFERKIYWVAKENPQSTSYLFDSTPHFQYFKNYRKTEKYKKDLKETGFTESMSLQGSFFMCTRDKYWELNLGNEEYGSWGSQGIQLACSFWLSGGSVLVNHSTYYAHLFRTQGADFGFPYPQSGRKVQEAKEYARKCIYENKFPKQIYPSSWLLQKFAPVPGWDEESINKLKEAEKDFKPYIGKVS